MAGTITFATHRLGTVKRIIATCTADAADGSFPATAIPSVEGRLAELRTNPGATAPQANYDISLVDGDGLDRLQALGQNRHTTNSEVAPIVYSGTALHPVISASETLTLTPTGNNVNGAITVISLVIVPA